MLRRVIIGAFHGQFMYVLLMSKELLAILIHDLLFALGNSDNQCYEDFQRNVVYKGAK